MTYIEFYDSEAVVNICSSLATAPDRVIILCGDKKPVLRRIPHYKRVLADRGHDVEFLCESVNKNSLQSIVEKLSSLVNTYDDIHVDLTGGEDLLLVAIGVVSERFPDKKIQLHRFNVINNSFYDCDGNGEVAIKEAPRLTVEENIRIHGGDVVFCDVRSGTTPRWDMNEDFLCDINRMWEICRGNPREWNTQLGVFAFAELLQTEENDSLTTIVRIDKLIEKLSVFKAKYVYLKRLIGDLESAGLLTCVNDGETITLTYKNHQIKSCLTKAGSALELKIYSIMRALEEKGEPMYAVLNGVFVDWDGEDDENRGETENEIDVLAVKGLVPVFISCKNGKVDAEELYKLKSVADRFGGAYARCILFTSTLDRESDFAISFRSRARSMGIEIIDNVTDMSDKDIADKLRNAWRK